MMSRRITLLLGLSIILVLSLSALHLGPEEYTNIAKAQLSRPFGSAIDAATLEIEEPVEVKEPEAGAEVAAAAEDSDLPAALDIYAFQEDTLADQFPSIASTGYQVPEYNVYTHNATTENLHTKLFIAFGRNWFVLHQCVVSYIAAGWPASDITIFDNSGTMNSNQLGALSIDNPAYANVTRLTELGVSYERVPTLLTFSQLQNYFLSTAMSRNLTYYFWSHMDVSILADEETEPYQSFYAKIIDDLVRTTKNMDNWALHFYAFDWLTLVNVNSYNKMGGWDVAIPYYTSDCDFYSRVVMWGEETGNGYELLSVDVGKIYDMSLPIANLDLFFPESGKSKLASPRYQKLKRTLDYDSTQKGNGDARNTWQNRQSGGHDDPYFKSTWIRDESFRRLNDMGRDVFEMKWHTGGACPAHTDGRKLKDMYN